MQGLSIFEDNSIILDSNHIHTNEMRNRQSSKIFFKSLLLTVCIFAAFQHTETHRISLERSLYPFLNISSVQGTSWTLKVDFALSKWPYLHRAYVESGPSSISDNVFLIRFRFTTDTRLIKIREGTNFEELIGVKREWTHPKRYFHQHSPYFDISIMELGKKPTD